MLIFETIAVAFSMFSALPMPQFEWTKGNMRYALCAFPLIGAIIGGAHGRRIGGRDIEDLPARFPGKRRSIKRTLALSHFVEGMHAFIFSAKRLPESWGGA